MAKTSTYIKLDRNIVGWRWYQNANTFRVFIHCLISANIKDKDFESINVKRGQLVTSHEKLAEALKLSVQQVRTALEHLKSTGELTITRCSKFLLVTIENYDTYQTKQQSINNQITINQQSNNNQLTINQQQSKNDKKDKKEKNIKNIENTHAHARTCATHAPAETDKPPKHEYGEFGHVLLSDDELEKLKQRFPDYEAKITNLDEAIEQHGYKYKNHYLTIIKWARKDDAERCERADGYNGTHSVKDTEQEEIAKIQNPFLRRQMQRELNERRGIITNDT